MDAIRDWLEKVGHSLGDEAMTTMSWADFVLRFREKFEPTIKV